MFGRELALRSGWLFWVLYSYSLKRERGQGPGEKRTVSGSQTVRELWLFADMRC